MTQVINKLWRLWRRTDIDNDMAVYGAPSECYAMAWRSFDKRADHICREAGVTRDEVYAEIAKRTSEKWAFFHFSWLV